VEVPMNMIGEDYNIPIYRFPIDENMFEAGFDTRLETFIKLLKRKKS
jgi:predicted nucleotide-binding protein (sugar kinase/HSP70/actin superfamily)